MRLARYVAAGVLAGAAGTAALDSVQYLRYRRKGGNASLGQWEFASDVTGWDKASAPGQLGREILQRLSKREPPDCWARATTNLVHWATGVGWGVQYALLASTTSDHPVLRALSLGPVAWLSSYVVLPLAKVYKPIWEYDAAVLADDLTAHLVYGAVTAGVFAALRHDDAGA